ncbi:MAG: hypothetical protein NWR72_21535, partial [Bacteroidia bacterium]|nr:hypothetical protein [Bacteroidia bacterium]
MGYRLFIIFSLALFPLQVLNAQQSLSLLKTYELERPLVLMEIRNHSAEVLLQAGKEMKENRDEMNPQDVRSMEVIIAAALLQQSGYDSIRTLLKWVDQSDEQASQYPQQALGEIILSLVNIFQNKYSETYEYAKSAGRQFLKQGDTANYAMSRSMEGLALYNLGIREEGLNTYRESINLYQITGFASEAELGKANLSAFYINSKNFQKGVELLDELLNTPQITLKPHFQVVAWGNYSLALLKLNRTDLALRYAVKTELMADTISFPVGKCYGKILQAKISQQIGDWSVAQQILDDLQELSNVMEGNPSLKSFYLHALGRQQDYRKEYAAAIQSFKSSAALAKPDLVFPSLDDAYAGWHGAASKMGDAEQASMVFQKMSAMKDSLYVASTNASLDLYAAREQLTQKDV